MRYLSHSFAALLLSSLLAGCRGSSTTGNAPGQPPVDQAKTADDQVAELLTQYEQLSKQDKVSDKGEKLLAQVKAVTGDFSENTKLMIAQATTSHNLAKLGVAVHQLDPSKVGFPFDPGKVGFPIDPSILKYVEGNAVFPQPEVLPPPRFNSEPEVLPPPRVQGEPGPAK